MVATISPHFAGLESGTNRDGDNNWGLQDPSPETTQDEDPLSVLPLGPSKPEDHCKTTG